MSLHGVVVVVVVWGVRGHLPSPGGTQVGLAVAATCPRRGVRKWLSSSCGARFCTYSDAPAAWSETDAHGCCRGCMHHLDAAWRVNRVSIQVVEERVWGLATNQEIGDQSRDWRPITRLATNLVIGRRITRLVAHHLLVHSDGRPRMQECRKIAGGPWNSFSIFSAFRALVILDSGYLAASEDHQTIARISRFAQSRYSTSAVRANHVIIKNNVKRITRFAHSA